MKRRRCRERSLSVGGQPGYELLNAEYTFEVRPQVVVRRPPPRCACSGPDILKKTWSSGGLAHSTRSLRSEALIDSLLLVVVGEVSHSAAAAHLSPPVNCFPFNMSAQTLFIMWRILCGASGSDG